MFSTFGESHASDIPFHAVARLLRAVAGLSGLADDAARERVRAQVPDADPQDLLLLDDLLGIADATMAQTSIDPDARRTRLAALINAMSFDPTPSPPFTSSRTRTGWMRSANPGSPIFCR